MHTPNPHPMNSVRPAWGSRPNHLSDAQHSTLCELDTALLTHAPKREASSARPNMGLRRYLCQSGNCRPYMFAEKLFLEGGARSHAPGAVPNAPKAHLESHLKYLRTSRAISDPSSFEPFNPKSEEKPHPTQSKGCSIWTRSTSCGTEVVHLRVRGMVESCCCLLHAP